VNVACNSQCKNEENFHRRPQHLDSGDEFNTTPIYMHISSRSVPERTSERLTHFAKVRVGSARYARYLFGSTGAARRPVQTTRGFLPRSCVSPTDVRTVSRVRARETESYREWRVSGEISKFPFNGIIKRSAERGIRGEPCDHVTFGKLAEIPRGLKGKLSLWQREMTSDFRQYRH
jgi:hypothetical protein